MIRWLVCTIPLMFLWGCASTGENAAESEVDPAEVVTEAVSEPAEEAETKAPPAPEDYPVAPFEGDSLYQLLVAEVAGYRSQYDLALEKYLAATIDTQDPGVAARATRLAQYMKRDEEALTAVMVWAKRDPDNIDAHRHAADLLLRAGRLEEAIVHMEAVKNLGGLAKFDVFAYRAAGLSESQRISLLEAITEMLARHPGDEQLMFSRAVLLEQTGDMEGALALTDELLQTSSNVNVVILKMSILRTLERTDEAKDFLRLKLEDFPDNRRLRLVFARMLFEDGELEQAKAQYSEVLRQSPNDGDVLFALALIALDQGNDAEAKGHFERMIRWNRRSGEAHYYLGGIAEREGDSEAALRYYRQAGNGYEYLPAQGRIVSILADDGRIEEARAHLERARQRQPDREQQLTIIEAQLLTERGMADEVLAFLDEVIAENPRDIDMLYFRAMTGQRFDRLDVLEADLRRVLDIDPDNADALNALGYTLTDQTERHEEAFVLIERALAQKPDEPAFIDSMGWVHYKLGNYELALQYLERAYELFRNDEVAAHLGEVLYVMGEHERALQVWQDALAEAPESDILKSVMDRFAATADSRSP